jgi:hypothetical protein
MDAISESLDLAGDALQRAWRSDLARGKRRHAAGKFLLVLAAALTVGVGAAWAGGLLKNSSDEQAGLIAANTLFSGSSPHCVRVSDVEFRCTLASAPTGETFFDAQGNQLLDVFNGFKVATTNSAGDIDGGCVGRRADGLLWECFTGQAAAEHGIVSASLLGQHSPGPAAG